MRERIRKEGSTQQIDRIGKEITNSKQTLFHTAYPKTEQADQNACFYLVSFS